MHYGWVIVAAAFSVLFVTYGVQYSFGLFFAALAVEFGSSRAALAGIFSLYAGAYAFCGLFAGRLTDRWGPRRVVACGGLLLGLGLALSGTVRSIGPLYATYLVAALGMSTAYVPCTATVSRWFTARRGLAVGVAMSGAGVGLFAFPPAAALLVARAGWRLAYLVLGLGVAGALLALSRLFATDPAARGLAPYGGAGGAAAGAAAESWPVARAIRHPSFAALVSVYTLTWIPVFMPLVHLVPFAGDLGLDPVTGASALSTLGVGSLLGRLGVGALSDLIGRRPALGLSLVLQTLGFAGLAQTRGAGELLVAAFVYGLAYGGITALMPALVADFFGPGHAGSLVGLIFGIAGPPAALGPVLGGVLFDRTGSYAWAFGGGALLNLLALVGVLLARPPRVLPPAALDRGPGRRRP